MIWLSRRSRSRLALFRNAPNGKPSVLNRDAAWRVFSLAALLLFAGCVPKLPRADLVIINGAEPESLDPAIITGQPDTRVVMCLYEGLLRNDAKTGGAIPGLAERWEISPDGLVYSFHLRTNAVWSSGERITADDVVFSWRRVLDPNTAADYAGQLFFVKNAEAFNAGKITDAEQVGVRALDPRTVRVELVSPTAFFLDLCAFQTLAVVPKKFIQQHGDNWLRFQPLPVSGPYQLEFWRLNDRIRLRKNPRYWDAANTSIEVVDILPIISASTALNLYEAGDADVIWDKALIPSELLDVLRRRPDFHSFDYLGSYFLRYNVNRKPFDDVRVRQALALAIDKQRIVEKITRGGEKVATHITPEGLKGYEAPRGLGYDPAKARSLLAGAGFPEGRGFPEFEYLFNAGAGGTASTDSKIAVELQGMWAQELGIHVRLKQLEWKIYLAAQSALDFDVSRSSWIGDYNDPNTFLDMFMSANGNNRTGWKNARYDELVRQGNAQTDLAKRAAMLREAETLLVETDLPIVPIYFYVGFNQFDPAKFTGIYGNLLDLHPLNAIRKTASAARGRPENNRESRIANHESRITNHE